MFRNIFHPPASDPGTDGNPSSDPSSGLGGSGSGSVPGGSGGGGGGGGGGEGGGTSSGGGAYKGSGFDPTGLERAAKAARELDKSPNSRNALALIQEQERTKQEEARAKSAQMDAYGKELELQRVGKQAEETRKTLKLQQEQNQQLEQYKDQLERKRQDDAIKQQIQAQRMIQEEARRKDEEAAARREALRKQNIEYEAKLRAQTEAAKVRAEAEGRILQERENHDLIMLKARQAARENRKTILESISVAGQTIGTGVASFLEDKEKITATIGTIGGFALAIYSAKVGTGVAGRFIEARLGKPSLVRDTSRTSVLEYVRNPFQALKRAFASGEPPEGALKGIVLEPKLTERLERIAVASANAKQNGAPYRNLLLHGPPGTGKTLFARGLAKNSGLDYAIMTGGDVGPLGKNAVTELHKMFDWAQTSRKGLLLFIDEADAFLRSRTKEQIGENLRSALNAFLYRTGEPTDKFMLVLASNQPDQFDWAANDRIDDIIEFNLPGLEERERMMNMYFKKYITEVENTKAKRILVRDIDAADLKKAAEVADGFSGREIAKLVIAMQSHAYGTRTAELNKDAFYDVIDSHVLQKKQKKEWLQGIDVGFAESHIIREKGQK